MAAPEGVVMASTHSNTSTNGIPKVLSATAPLFVPGAPGGAGANPVESQGRTNDVMQALPPTHHQYLRKYFQGPSGNMISYYLGRLKSYNQRNGYGFLECPQSMTDWGTDVFIHKGLVPNPWTIGQPVEFAVVVNSRGQPQAVDVNWLPRVPDGIKAGVGGAGIASGAMNAVIAVPVVSGDSVGARTSVASDAGSPTGPRYIGTLKSFSATQGYGFITCEELFQSHQRDTYLDRSQMPASGWRTGMLVEFTCTFNSRGHPQARFVKLDPFPCVKVTRGEGGAQISFNPVTIDNFKKIHKLIEDKSIETAVLTAIESQGNPKGDHDFDPNADFVTYVLDRLGPSPDAEAIKGIKDFVNMLLALMISKMLRQSCSPEHCHKLGGWFKLLINSITETDDSLHAHIGSVSEQVQKHVEEARTSNLALVDDNLYSPLVETVRVFRQKAGAALERSGNGNL